MVEVNAKIRLANGNFKPLTDIKDNDIEDILIYDHENDEYSKKQWKFDFLGKRIKLKTYYLLTHNSNDNNQNNMNSSIYLSEDQIIRVKIGLEGKYNYTKVKDLCSFLKTYDSNDDNVDVFIKIFKSFSSEDDDKKPLDYIAKYTEDKVFLINKQKMNTFGLYKYEDSSEKEFIRLLKPDFISFVLNGILL